LARCQSPLSPHVTKRRHCVSGFLFVPHLWPATVRQSAANIIILATVPFSFPLHDAISVSDYMASNESIINYFWIGKYLGRNSCGLLKVLSRNLLGWNEENHGNATQDSRCRTDTSRIGMHGATATLCRPAIVSQSSCFFVNWAHIDITVWCMFILRNSKSSLRLIKHYAMIPYVGSGGTPPSFSTLALHVGEWSSSCRSGKECRYPLDKGLGGPPGPVWTPWRRNLSMLAIEPGQSCP
jgi:hypothetical protein